MNKVYAIPWGIPRDGPTSTGESAIPEPSLDYNPPPSADHSRPPLELEALIY
jgi:hypothetical protein